MGLSRGRYRPAGLPAQQEENMNKALFGSVSVAALAMAGAMSVAAADFEVIHHFTAQTEAESLGVVAESGEPFARESQRAPRPAPHSVRKWRREIWASACR